MTRELATLAVLISTATAVLSGPSVRTYHLDFENTVELQAKGTDGESYAVTVLWKSVSHQDGQSLILAITEASGDIRKQQMFYSGNQMTLRNATVEPRGAHDEIHFHCMRFTGESVVLTNTVDWHGLHGFAELAENVVE